MLQRRTASPAVLRYLSCPASPKKPRVVLESVAMNSVTGTPPPEPSFLEQVGAWLGTFAAVPNWVNWVIVWLAIATVVGVPILTFLWRRWGANRWAARSSVAAAKRARKLGNNVLRAHRISRNRPAMLVDSLRWLASLIISCMFIVLAAVVVHHLYAPAEDGQPPSELLIRGRMALAWIAMGGAYFGLFRFTAVYFSRIAPLVNIDRYTQQSRTRIEDLFSKAKVPEDVAAERLDELDALIKQAREEEIR